MYRETTLIDPKDSVPYSACIIKIEMTAALP